MGEASYCGIIPPVTWEVPDGTSRDRGRAEDPIALPRIELCHTVMMPGVRRRPNWRYQRLVAWYWQEFGMHFCTPPVHEPTAED